MLYPLVDVAAVADARSSGAGRLALALYVNVAVSLLAGAVQFAVGVTRCGLDGQWPMILSGGISVLAGTSFILQAVKDGVFFLVSALRLGVR